MPARASLRRSRYLIINMTNTEYRHTEEIINSTSYYDEVLITDATGDEWFDRRYKCQHCKKADGLVVEQYSMGITAGYYHDGECWDKAPYRKGGKEIYDYYDAGEYYDEADAF